MRKQRSDQISQKGKKEKMNSINKNEKLEKKGFILFLMVLSGQQVSIPQIVSYLK